jgi:Pentapeptide repeats (8 copies)
MADPATLAVALSKLIGLGLGAWKAHEKHGVGEEDFKLVQSLIDAGLGVAGLRKDDSGKKIAALHFVLVTGAFGEAFRRHWYGDKHFAPGTGWWEWVKQDEIGRARMKQIEERLRIAAPRFKEVGGLPAEEEIGVIASLIGDPLATPYYRRLWGAFTDPSLSRAGEESLILADKRLQFERHFRLAYAEGLASSGGEEIRRYLLSLGEDRALLVRELLIRDMATWGGRHVFGNVAEHADLPLMPLAGMYVEPYAGNDSIEDEPVLGLLERLFVEHPVIVLQADFGHGKSLTARMIAWQKAQAYLAEEKPSPELWRPVFVKCAEDFESHGDELEKIIKRAQWRQSGGMRLGIPLGDKAFEMPVPQARTLFLIDGLDEVALADQEVKSFFQRMREQSSVTRRFIVFTRPAALRYGEHLKDIPIFDLRSLRIEGAQNQIDAWLAKWSAFTNRDPRLTANDIDKRQLLEIAQTPILLFMIAHTWNEDVANTSTRGDVYESFFRVMARGKYEKGGEQHPVIVKASEDLRDRLRAKGHILEDADAPEAMLWLMSRVAWKGKCMEDAEWLEGKKKVLALRHVQEILSDELDLEGDSKVEKTIQVGLWLALQANMEEGTPRILFGHKSFREFLVGRYWASELRRHTKDGGREWEMEVKEPLLQGRLLGEEDESFRFLRDALNRKDDAERRDVARWAQRCFDDESASNGAKGMRTDRRPLLREAALAIGSAISDGMTAKDPLSLLSMVAWFWVQHIPPMVLAPKLKARGEHLSRVVISERSNFHRADLSEADLSEAYLSGVNLSGANLNQANLNQANLSRADLSRANLSGAYLNNAYVRGAYLREANLSGAYLGAVHLRGANLSGAKLNGADLTGAKLNGADLNGADLRGAYLRGANLRGANLRGADLRGADLREVDLREVDLSDVNLTGANLPASYTK